MESFPTPQGWQKSPAAPPLTTGHAAKGSVITTTRPGQTRSVRPSLVLARISGPAPHPALKHRHALLVGDKPYQIQRHSSCASGQIPFAAGAVRQHQAPTRPSDSPSDSGLNFARPRDSFCTGSIHSRCYARHRDEEINGTLSWH